VVVVVAGEASLARHLAALEVQCDSTVEVLVPYVRTGALDAELHGRARVRGMARDGPREPAELRAMAIAAARGAIVACTEDHCLPADDWCARIRAAHERLPHVAIGGVVDKLEPDTAVGWATYLTDYGRYMPPLPDAPSPSLTDCNVSYKRGALLEVRDAWRASFHETAVHGALRERGGTLWLDPSIVVAESRPAALRVAIRDRFHHGRLYAGLRAGSARRSVRLVRAGASILLPAVIVARALSTLRRRKRGGGAGRQVPRRAARGTLAALLGLSTAWAAGEFSGYVAPPRT
jgi:hypothetical protein